MKEYINFLKKNNYSKNTILTYKSILRIYKNDINDIRKLKKRIQKYFGNPNTAWTHYNVICSYMRWANDKRLKNFKELKLPKLSLKYMEVFNKNYLNKKTEIKEKDSFDLINKKRLIKFLFETGIRACEINQIKEINRSTILVLGKGNKIREVFHNYENTKMIDFKNVTTKTIRIWVKQILGNKYTPHSIRRSHATHLLVNGANPKMVMQQLGHEKIETTFRYLQLSKQANQKIYDKFF